MIFPSQSETLKKEFGNYIGSRINKWLVKEWVILKNRSYYIIECMCGRISKRPAYKVINGSTSSCNSCANTKHGYTGTPTNRCWNQARNRCNNPNNKDFKDWGGRGIKMCDRWNKFENFLEDMGEKPSGFTLDRINNDGDYEPGNCRWATYRVQNRNQRKRKNKGDV